MPPKSERERPFTGCPPRSLWSSRSLSSSCGADIQHTRLAQVKLARRNRCPTLSLPKSPPSQVSHAACPPAPLRRGARAPSLTPLSLSNPTQSRNRTSPPSKPPNSRQSAQSRPRPTSAKLPPRKLRSNARTNSTSANPKPAPKRNSRKRPSNCGNRGGAGIL